MLYFALFTVGYFAGVFTALAIFPPRTKEIEEQEIDALKPILDMEREREEAEVTGDAILGQPLVSSN